MDRAKDDVCTLVDCLLRHRLCDSRVCLCVRRNIVDLATEDTAGCIDLLHRQLDAVVEVVTRSCPGSGQLHDAVEHYWALLGHRGERNACEDCKSERPKY